MNSTCEILSDRYIALWHKLVLSSTMHFMSAKLNKYMKHCEDYILLVLHNHEELFDTRHLAKFSTFSVIPASVVILILVTALASIIATLRYAYRQLWAKKSMRRSRNSFWFYVQALGTIVSVTLLLTGIVATFKIALLLDNSMRNDIATARGVFRDLHNEKTKFELHLIDINETLVNLLVSAEHALNNIPASVSQSLVASVEKEVDDARKCHNDIMLKSDYLFGLTGLEDTNRSGAQSLEEQLRVTERLTKVFTSNLHFLEVDIKSKTSNRTDVLEDIANINDYMLNVRGHYKFPNWIIINKHLHNIFDNILPQINESLSFTHGYSEMIRTRSRNEISLVTLPLYEFQNESSAILKRLHSISQKIYPKELKWFVKDLISTIDTKLSDINGNGSLIGEFYASTLIILTPVLHSKLYAILMTIVCIHAVYQMKFVYTRDINGTTYSNCSVIASKLITLFGLSLLWTGLVLATLCFTGALSLSIVCTPIMSDHLYTKYIDNTAVWANNTWLDQIMYPWGHGYRVRKVLEKCSQNVTIYYAFDVQKYWNISQHFEHREISVNNARLVESIENAILSVQVPDGKMVTFAKDNFSFVEKEIKQLSPHIMYDVEKFQNDALKESAERLAEKVGAIGNSEYNEKLTENLNILEFVAGQKLEEMLNDLMDIKYMVKVFQNDLTRIQYLQTQIRNTIDVSFNHHITAAINNVSDYIHTLWGATEMGITKQLENEISNCHFMPKFIETVKHRACVRMPLLLNMLWPLLLIDVFLMVFCMILSTCMCGYMTAVQRQQQIWRERIERDRQRETTKRLTAGTLLFDRTGRFLGESRSIVSADEDATQGMIGNHAVKPAEENAGQ